MFDNFFLSSNTLNQRFPIFSARVPPSSKNKNRVPPSTLWKGFFAIFIVKVLNWRKSGIPQVGNRCSKLYYLWWLMEVSTLFTCKLSNIYQSIALFLVLLFAIQILSCDLIRISFKEFRWQNVYHTWNQRVILCAAWIHESYDGYSSNSVKGPRVCLNNQNTKS